MKHYFLFAIIFSCFLIGCKNEQRDKTSLEAIEPSPIDSFTVKGIDLGQQVLAFQYIDDSTLSSYNLIYKELVFFKKDGNSTYRSTSHQPIEMTAWGTHFIGDDNLNYFISRENRLITYDRKASGKISDKPIYHVFEHIKDSFMILASHEAPVIKRHDTLITAYGYNSLQSYNQYLKEPTIAEFKINKDSVTLIKNYMVKPNGLGNYYLPIQKYTVHNNTIALLYPCYDTVYTYNRSTHESSKKAINNRDYKLPERYDNKMVFNPNYGSYMTKYALNNFQYSAFYFNELTKHYVLFYFAPVTEKFKDRAATPADQKMRAVILDDAFNVVGYRIFDIKGYVEPNSYFYIPNKGFAIPTVKSTEDFETTKFYIYNL